MVLLFANTSKIASDECSPPLIADTTGSLEHPRLSATISNLSYSVCAVQISTTHRRFLSPRFPISDRPTFLFKYFSQTRQTHINLDLVGFLHLPLQSFALVALKESLA